MDTIETLHYRAAFAPCSPSVTCGHQVVTLEHRAAWRMISWRHSPLGETRDFSAGPETLPKTPLRSSSSRLTAVDGSKMPALVVLYQALNILHSYICGLTVVSFYSFGPAYTPTALRS